MIRIFFNLFIKLAGTPLVVMGFFKPYFRFFGLHGNLVVTERQKLHADGLFKSLRNPLILVHRLTLQTDAIGKLTNTVLAILSFNPTGKVTDSPLRKLFELSQLLTNSNYFLPREGVGVRYAFT